ncbi:uncharacterized protein ACRADG_003996 [Cochliomyia hominivorax]
MGWCKELVLVLIIGLLAVNAADDEGKSDARYLLKPFFSETSTTTTSKPDTVVVKPSYPLFPLYPYYPHEFYPSYPPYKPPHPTYSPQQSTYYPQYPLYHPTKGPKPPVSYPPYPPLYPYYPPPYYDYESLAHPPYVIIVQNPIKPNDNMPIPEVIERPMKPKPEPGNANNNMEPEVVRPANPAANDAGEARNVFRNPDGDVVKIPLRKTKVNGISVKDGSAQVGDNMNFESKYIRLPFDVQIAGSPNLYRKINEQEAVIYLRNYKKGRRSRVAKKKA